MGPVLIISHILHHPAGNKSIALEPKCYKTFSHELDPVQNSNVNAEYSCADSCAVLGTKDFARIST